MSILSMRGASGYSVGNYLASHGIEVPIARVLENASSAFREWNMQAEATEEDVVLQRDVLAVIGEIGAAIGKQTALERFSIGAILTSPRLCRSKATHRQRFHMISIALRQLAETVADAMWEHLVELKVEDIPHMPQSEQADMYFELDEIARSARFTLCLQEDEAIAEEATV